MAFAILYTCGDERCHGRALPYLKRHLPVEGVFMVARPGGIGVLASSDDSRILSIREEVEDYCSLRDIEVVAFAGHVGCARNFTDRDGQVEQLLACEKLVRSWRLKSAKTARLYVDSGFVEYNPQRIVLPEAPLVSLFAT